MLSWQKYLTAWGKQGNYRRKAEGRGQKEENIIFCPLPKGFKAPKFIYEKKKKSVFRDAQRKEYCVPIESPLFIYGVSLLPFASSIAAFCLLNEFSFEPQYTTLQSSPVVGGTLD